jgi:hypothetical protein
MIPNPNVPGATLDDNPLVQLIMELGVELSYRRSYAATAQPNANLTAGTEFVRPIGTRDAAFDPTEDAVLDSTIDAATGFVGAYAVAFTVHALLSGAERGTAAYAAYGAELDQPITCYLLSREVVPVRGDLIIHPNGERYVIGEQQRSLGTSDRPAVYAVSVEHRTDHADPVYTV